MGFYPQHQPGASAVLGDSTSGIQLGDSFITPESVQLTNFITLGTIAAASFPTATTKLSDSAYCVTSPNSFVTTKVK